MKQLDESSKIGWITHTYGPIDPKVYFNHLGCMLKWSRKFNVVFVGIDKHRAADARNILIKTAKSMKCTHVLIVDADHILPDHMLECLSKNEDATVVSGLIAKRKPPYSQVGFVRTKDGEEYAPIQIPCDGQSYLVDIPAMGCTLIDIDIFDTIDEPYFIDTLGKKSDGGVYNKRSDTNFFEKVKAAGHKIIIDSRVLVGHMRDAMPVYPNFIPDVKKWNREDKIRKGDNAKAYQLEVYRKMATFINPTRITGILDLGCGNPSKLLDFVDSTNKIVGIDFPEKILDIAAVGNEVNGPTDKRWLGKDLDEEFDLAEKFGIVVCADVIEHVNDADMLLDNAKRHMTEDSVLILSSPEKKTVLGENPLHVREYSKEELSALLYANDLEVVEHKVYKEENDAPYDNNIFVCVLSKKESENGVSDKT
ncbi:MAG: methyltransferase domain-containing protein [Candidatus Thorarchaeota archaeon]|jgi:2-polyprenyl-3-methyl-5-hydroxy-6-metoxy-1,4-benzoquinol methylase